MNTKKNLKERKIYMSFRLLILRKEYKRWMKNLKLSNRVINRLKIAATLNCNHKQQAV
jgi:hypothetical protein